MTEKDSNTKSPGDSIETLDNETAPEALFIGTFDELLSAMCKQVINEEATEIMNEPVGHYEPSRQLKVKINRLFRNMLESAHLPYPEADSRYERLRSRLARPILRGIRVFIRIRKK